MDGAIDLLGAQRVERIGVERVGKLLRRARGQGQHCGRGAQRRGEHGVSI